MRIRANFIHLADMVTPGAVTGKDAYNRPIYGAPTSKTIPCRADQIERRASTDPEGTDTIVTNVLFIGPEVQVTDSSTFKNIRDKNGNPILEGSFSIDNIFPVNSRVRLNHYEVTLKEG